MNDDNPFDAPDGDHEASAHPWEAYPFHDSIDIDGHTVGLAVPARGGQALVWVDGVQTQALRSWRFRDVVEQAVGNSVVRWDIRSNLWSLRARRLVDGELVVEDVFADQTRSAKRGCLIVSLSIAAIAVMAYLMRDLWR